MRSRARLDDRSVAAFRQRTTTPSWSTLETRSPGCLHCDNDAVVVAADAAADGDGGGGDANWRGETEFEWVNRRRQYGRR